MGEIKLNGTPQFSQLIGEQIKARVRADFRSDNNGPKKVLTRAFDNALEQKGKELVGKIATHIEPMVAKHYRDSFDVVKLNLDGGIGAGSQQVLVPDGSGGNSNFETSWKPFAESYYKRKLRRFSQNADKFWIYSGGADKSNGVQGVKNAYAAYAGFQKIRLARLKPFIHLERKGYKNQNRVFQWRMEFTLPVISGPGDKVFRQPFLLGVEGKWDTSELPNPGVGAINHYNSLSVMFFNESEGHKTSRPFIRRLMAERGKQMRIKFQKELTR